jgi:hypothetical protein
MSSELKSWLAELIHQQHHRDERITEVELYRSFDRWLDAYNAQGGAMTNDPAGEPFVVPLTTGEIVTVTVAVDQVLLALYAVPDEQTGSGDDTVLPAQAMVLTADECETLGSLLTYSAVAVYGQRPRLRAVEDGEHNDVR